MGDTPRRKMPEIHCSPMATAKGLGQKLGTKTSSDEMAVRCNPKIPTYLCSGGLMEQNASENSRRPAGKVEAWYCGASPEREGPPMAALGAALCMESHLTIAAATARGLLRVRKDPGENFQGIIPEVLKSGGIFLMSRNKMTKAFMFDRKYRISLSERSDWATGLEKLPADGEIWYTDGS